MHARRKQRMLKRAIRLSGLLPVLMEAVVSRRLRFLLQGHTMAGQMYRMTTCEITYGPLNCDFIFKADNECAACQCRPLPSESGMPAGKFWDFHALLPAAQTNSSARLS